MRRIDSVQYHLVRRSGTSRKEGVMRVVALSLFAHSVLAGASVRCQKGAGDKEKMLGTWQVVLVDSFGMKEIPPEVLKESRVTFTADKMTFKIGPEQGEL